MLSFFLGNFLLTLKIGAINTLKSYNQDHNIYEQDLPLYAYGFGTKNRERTIFPEHKEDLLKVLFAELKDMGCYVYRINAMTDHVHLFF